MLVPLTLFPSESSVLQLYKTQTEDLVYISHSNLDFTRCLTTLLNDMSSDQKEGYIGFHYNPNTAECRLLRFADLRNNAEKLELGFGLDIVYLAVFNVAKGTIISGKKLCVVITDLNNT